MKGAIERSCRGARCARGILGYDRCTASIVLADNSGDGALTGNADLPISYSSQTATWSDLKVSRQGSGHTLVVIVEGGCGTTAVGLGGLGR
jgi:hypothetical protein